MSYGCNLEAVSNRHSKGGGSQWVSVYEEVHLEATAEYGQSKMILLGFIRDFSETF